MNIQSEMRKQLKGFLEKVLDQSYTRHEWEMFALSTYQNEALEEIRQSVMQAIQSNTKDGIQQPLNDFHMNEVKALIAELEKMAF